MAAEVLGTAGHRVSVFEGMPTVGRKLLMAGKSGLNITHGEAHELLRGRYGAANERLAAALDAFDGAAVRAWCTELGVETFTGSSGRVFPKHMKASPLLRAWLARLGKQGVAIRTRWRWIGFAGDRLAFATPEGERLEQFDAVVLALGGASWPKLGSDAAWVPWLEDKGVEVAPFRPANSGFEVGWSLVFAERYAGEPVKAITANGVPGEFVVTRWGIEGSLVYTQAARLRDALEAQGDAALDLDLAPGRAVERLAEGLSRQPAKASFSNRLRKGAGLEGVKLGLLRELVPEAIRLAPDDLALRIKSLSLPVLRTRPIAEAISSAGGIRWSNVDQGFMLSKIPGMFVSGEMLDWEAPTGGYLLTACLATGRAAGLAAAAYAA
jgi:uncharacterized flavoprotein (TIGR03862 family)